MSTQLTIRARLNETITPEGIGIPTSVTITGGNMLASSGLGDIAQALVDDYTKMANGSSGYLADYTRLDSRPHVIVVPIVKY